MKVDRSAFLQLVTILAASACGPAGGGQPTASGAPSATTSSVGTPATEGATAASPTSDGTTTATTTATTTGMTTASGCDAPMIGPCGEGLSTRDYCKGIADGLDDARRAVFFACTKKTAALVDLSDKSCAERAHKCGATTARCREADAALDACRKKITTLCEDGPEAKKENACFEKCLVAASKAKDPGKAMVACQTTCGGEPGNAAKKCVTAGVAKDCKGPIDANDGCSAAMTADCAIPATCNASLSAACKSADDAFDKCAAAANKN